MEIIKAGEKPEDKTATVRCKKCNCVFKFAAKEAEFVSDWRDGNSYKIKCPECTFYAWANVTAFK